MANQADAASPGQGEQHVVGAVAVVVHPHGIVVRVGVDDHGGDAVEHGHGVQPLGQQPEPLLRHRVGPQHVVPALGGCASYGDALFRRKVPALGASPQDAQVVRHGVHEAPLGQLLQPVAEHGGWNASEAGQLVHGGEGCGAEQQERLLETLAQGTQRRVRPQALQIDDDLERGCFNRSDAVADRAQDGGGHGAPCVAPFEETPQGVAGHAEVLGCLAPSVQRRVGVHVAPDRPFQVRSALRRAVQGLGSWLRDDQSTAPCGNDPTSHFEREIAPKQCLARHCLGGGLVVVTKEFLVRAAASGCKGRSNNGPARRV